MNPFVEREDEKNVSRIWHSLYSATPASILGTRRALVSKLEVVKEGMT